MTRDEVLKALHYRQLRDACHLDYQGQRRAARELAAAERLCRMKGIPIPRNPFSKQSRECEGQILRYRWDEMPMPPKATTI